MKVLYILNEASFYMQMAYVSLGTLREYNKDIPVEILMVLDGQRDNRYIGRIDKNNIAGQQFDIKSFVESCERYKVEFTYIKDLDLKEEKGFHPVQRMAFSQVKDDQILLLDADTFVMGDVEPFFDSLNQHDLVADLNAWGQYGYKIPYGQYELPAFNSGVVLFNRGILNEYGKQVYDLCLKVKGNEHPIGKWLTEAQRQEGSQGKLGREEAAFSLFVHENKINYRLSSPKEIQTNDIRCKTMIHHTQVQNYLKYWGKYFRTGTYEPVPKINRKIFGSKIFTLQPPKL